MHFQDSMICVFVVLVVLEFYFFCPELHEDVADLNCSNKLLEREPKV